MVSKLQKYLDNLEKFLEENIFSNFPPLADYIEKPLVKYLPFISLVLGLLCLLSAYDLWQTAHTVNSLVIYANNFKWTTGYQKLPVNYHMGLAFWLGMLSLIIEALLFFKAISGLNKRIKSGWKLVYYALVLNVVYGIVMLFSTYGGSGNLIERLLFSLVCFYFLFSIIDSYKSTKKNKKAN